ncbi:glutamine synthetase family protein, partial [Patescibacteria group bacterium]|nr:glutamine synthetase family protein [Patescibacteria group bacterium]
MITDRLQTSAFAGDQIKGHERPLPSFFVEQDGLLVLDYAELEKRNLEMKAKRLSGVASDDVKDEIIDRIANDKSIKAVTLCFSDMEGKLHYLDYDKKFVIDAHENLTFDGSSIKGFSAQSESDLRLKVDWVSLRWVPADLFGAGKVLVFANVCSGNGEIYEGDFRARLAEFSADLYEKGLVVNVAPEIEGFLFKGDNAEQSYTQESGFEFVTATGYYNCLPKDILRLFIDKFAEVQRALGFENEKDHPEVAPSQFELNFKYSSALDTADQIQIYKLCARQVAKLMGLTVSFLPKPVQEVNGSGMHTNISISKEGKNLFYDAEGELKLSKDAHRFITAILYYAKDLCLLMNSSVNSYRRLDPHFEAPNEIKMSAVDRGSMVRIPIGNEKSARIEVRTVA